MGAGRPGVQFQSHGSNSLGGRGFATEAVWGPASPGESRDGAGAGWRTPMLSGPGGHREAQECEWIMCTCVLGTGPGDIHPFQGSHGNLTLANGRQVGV